MYSNRIGRRERGTMTKRIFWNRFWMSTYLHLRINDFFSEPYCTHISNTRREKKFSWNRALNDPIRLHEVFDSIVKGLSTITQISIILHDSIKIELCLSFFIFPPGSMFLERWGQTTFAVLRNFQITVISECLMCYSGQFWMIKGPWTKICLFFIRNLKLSHEVADVNLNSSRIQTRSLKACRILSNAKGHK